MTLTQYQKRGAYWLIIAVVFGVLLWLLGPVLTPFVVAIALAYLLNPMVEKLHTLFRGKVPRFVSVSIAMLVFVLTVSGLVMLIAPVIIKEMPLLRAQVPSMIDQAGLWLQRQLTHLGVPPGRLNFDTMRSMALEALSSTAEVGGKTASSVLSSLMVGGSVALAVVSNAVLIPMVMFYLLLDWDRFLETLFKLVPRRYREMVLGFCREADEMLGKYVRGQLLVMLILAAWYAIALSFFGFDLALPVGIFTGLAVFVPYLGFGVGLAMTFFFGLLQMGLSQTLVMVIVVFGVAQLAESLFLTPRFVGESIGLNPILVIFLLLSFGQLFGFVGVLVALPCSAVLVVAVRRARAKYLQSNFYND